MDFDDVNANEDFDVQTRSNTKSVEAFMVKSENVKTSDKSKIMIKRFI